jgi:hypothetical protein
MAPHVTLVLRCIFPQIELALEGLLSGKALSAELIELPTISYDINLLRDLENFYQL